MTEAVAAPRRILGFGAWLAPKDAQALEGAVERLRQAAARAFAWRSPASPGAISTPTAARSAAAPCCASAKSPATGWS